MPNQITVESGQLTPTQQYEKLIGMGMSPSDASQYAGFTPFQTDTPSKDEMRLAVARNRAGQPVQGTPLETFTGAMQGLGNMLGSAAVGTGASILGTPGNIESLGRQAINYVSPDTVSPQTNMPTSEDILNKAKQVPILQDYADNVATKLGENVVGGILDPYTMVKGIKATKGMPVGMSIQDVRDPARQALAEALAKAPVKVPEGVRSETPELIGNYNALPLRRKDLVARSSTRSDKEIDKIAQRVADQMMGLHVTSGKKGDTTNLAGRSMRENERIKNVQYELTPTGNVAEPVPYEPKEGHVIVGTPGDQTISDYILSALNGREINSHQTGGGKYAMGQRHREDPLGWNSNFPQANMYQNKITDLAKYVDVDPENIYGMHMGMGRDANNFAQHFADANLKAIDVNSMKPEHVESFNNLMREGWSKKKSKDSDERIYFKFPDFPGIENPKESYEAMLKNPEMRKHFNKLMKIPKVTKKYGLPNGLDVEWAISEPSIRNMEVGMSGLGVSRMTPFRTPVPDPSYAMYGHGFPAVGIGPSKVLMPVEIGFPDATEHIMATQSPSDFTGTIQKVYPHQYVDKQYLDAYHRYKQALENKLRAGRYKKGGVVKRADGGSVAQTELAKMKEILEKKKIENELSGMAKRSEELKSYRPYESLTEVKPVTQEQVNAEYQVRQSKPTVGLRPTDVGGSKIPSTQLELFKKKGGVISFDEMRLALARKR